VDKGDRQRRTIRLFDSLADRYDAWLASPGGSLANRLEQHAMLRAIPLDGNQFALDLGCGTGQYTRSLALRGYQMVGADPSRAMLAVARVRGSAGDRVAYVQAIGEALPFRDATFAVAVAMTVLEFVDSDAAVLRELARTIKRPGTLVVGTLQATSPSNIVRRLRPSSTLASAHRFYRRAELVRRLGTLGPVRSWTVVHFPLRIRSWRLALLLERLGRRWFPWAGAMAVLAVRVKRLTAPVHRRQGQTGRKGAIWR